MRFNNLKTTLKTAVLVTTVLLLGAGLSVAQQQVNLAAGPSTVTLPDGTTVPMWGYTCGAAVTGSTATCAALNTTATGWSPVVITVPAGQDLTINLTNNLPVPPGAAASAGIPTSLTIVGQLGGGLGTTATSTLSPDHTGAQANVTWPIAAPGGGAGVPPVQANRVQSFSTEVATGATTATALTWTAPRPGTYLLESGTHPSIQGPMGLYGIVVVTSAPGSTAPGAVGTAGCAYGAGTSSTGTATCAVPYNAEIPLLLSEIDPLQNSTVNAAVNTAGFSETMVWSGQPGGCGNPASTTYLQCYPPAVNYKPLYYLINGVAFDKTKTSASPSLFAATAGVTTATPPAPVTTGIAGTVLVRLVNAGLRMHVPSIVGALTTPPIFTVGTTPAQVAGFSLIAEDGNPLPGVSRVQSEVFMAAGKTYDVMIDVPAAGGTALPIFDRELSLSANATARDAGMLAYIGVNGAGLPTSGAFVATAVARPDTYNSVITGKTLTVSDPGKGVIANDTNVFGVQLVGTVAGLTLNPDGTFTYTGAPTSFTYCANGSVTGTTCSSGLTATVTLGAAPIEAAGGITCTNSSFSSNMATTLSIKPAGILAGCIDAAGYPLTVNAASVTSTGFSSLSVDPNGGFNAAVSAAGTYTFTFKAQNSQGTVAANAATVTLTFPTASGLVVNVVDGRDKTTPVTDYRWVIEEDRTFYVNPGCTTNPPAAGCPSAASGIVPTFGTNFHTSYMPLVATGCVGPAGTAVACESGQTLLGVAAVCDVGNGVCRTDAAAQTPVDPSQVHLDPTKRYYISVLPGDAANSFENAGGCLGNATPSCGHGMGGAPIACIPTPPAVTCAAGATFPPVTVLVQPNPFPPSKLSVFVFEDDFPLNGEQDGGGGIDVLSPNEPGLGSFNITLFDDAGGTGDATGQMTYDMFNQPLSNSLAGTKDPSTGLDACPLSAAELVGVDSSNGNLYGSPSPTGITGTIVTCPKYESDNVTLSPLAGQAVVANLMPGRYGVVATPGADRIGRGEEWLQTNTLDGQKAHDSFLRIGEPSFFQEFGPAGYHVSIGFANPKIINDRLAGVCAGTDPNITGTSCSNTLTGQVTNEHLSRTPDERLYSSGDYTHFGFTQCYVSFGDPDGEDFAFTKCNADGTFTLSGLPSGDWRVTVFDQWNDMLVDGLSTPVRLAGGTTNLGQIATSQWQANIYTSTFFDQNGDGVRQDNEPGLALVSTNIRFRDGSYSNFNNTDLSGNAGFNEVFPLFSWYVIETDSTRYKSMGSHVVYDVGGPVDGTCTSTTAPCGSSTIAGNLANTAETVSLPTNLRVPGAVYCANADCTGKSLAAGPSSSDPPSVCTTNTTTGVVTCSTTLSSGRIDPPIVHPYGSTYGWQGFSGQNSFIEFAKKPFAVGETGGIHGEVIYASTRPFDDPSLLIHTSWTPDVPGVTINLYKEGTAPDGTTSLTLVDTTKTSSFDDWAQGFHLAADGVTQIPNMNCPGQGPATGTAGDIFFYTLFNQPMWLDVYNHGATATTPLPNNSQFKCYDGMHNWNQVQPAPYDGMYQFPSVTSINPTTGEPAGTNCTACVTNPDASDPYRYGGSATPVPYVSGSSQGAPMLPAGKYVVEMIVPPGYELVKEEDKNILIGDNYIAPVTQEFGGLGGIFILPDQAEVASLYNANNPNNPTQTLGRTSYPSSEGDTGSVETFWPCVGASRVVPDFISLFPQSGEVSPFAGATRNLCDRKEVTLTEQASVLAKFWVFTSAHVAAHYTGVITDDYTSEFDPFSPQFGEKFSPPDLPVSIKDWSGTEVSRTYADQWGTYDGLTYSTWEVNPPNPTGYAPTMMVTCMNDPGPIPGPGGTMITDPLFTQGYSQFCYEIPFMPGQTQYMDTPVVPTAAFAGAGYNNVDCSYPANTPAIAEVDGDGVGPWVSAGGHTITITALGDQTIPNYAYSGPAANTAPYNQKTITRHYGFGPAPAGGCSNGNPNAACPSVTVGGIPLHGVTWTDTTITGTVQANVPLCSVTSSSYRGANATARCGQLVITAANGQQSIDSVTVTIGGTTPVHVPASGSIQSAIDAAAPGALIIVDPTCTVTATGVPTACTPVGATAGVTNTAAAHNELLLMWKPVRLQGVGAATSIINATTHPAGKLDVWRRQVNCLFGLSLSGAPISGTNPYDPTGTFACPAAGWNSYNPTANNPQIDRLPLEATVGWDASLNGNLAELLQEPSLMGALEGAAITVLSKGVFFPSNPFDPTLLAGFPTGTILFSSTNTSTYCNGTYTSNFWCNPSGVDGLGITDSSQGGGGVFVHGWGHNLQIANNRIYNNSGTLSGGINVGQGEFPPQYIQGGATNAPPGSCETSTVTGVQLPYCHNLNVNIHNNNVSLNSSTGDELFSATPAGAGGVSFCTGSDYYKFNYNWVCGNLSSGDGGGIGHLGFTKNGDIEHNTVVFNQSTNPTIPTNGGGLIIMGTPDVDPPCGTTTDADCVPADLSTIGPSDGVGPGLVINANLIMGNAAESGSGGGIAFQNVNGGDVVAFPTTPANWHHVVVTNNIIVDNVAGWDGAGVSLLDALNLDLVNNTIASNSTTASAGMLFTTIGAPLASTLGTNCTVNNATASCPQPAGLVSIHNSAVLSANLPTTVTVTCPANHYTGTSASNGSCRNISSPLIKNNVFWQNSAYFIGVGALGGGTLNQQNIVSLYNAFTTTLAPNQPQADATTAHGSGQTITGGTGACVAASYWDIGVRGDTGPGNHASTFQLAPTYSVLTNSSETGLGSNNLTGSTANPNFASQYCDGSRTPPEFGASGWAVPPGIADATVPNPIFNLTPTATVDEGNNWINMRWGPLSLLNPATSTATTNVVLGNYRLTAGSPAINAGNGTGAPTTDFFGNTRPQGGAWDIGAVEFLGAGGAAVASVTGGPLAFGSVPVGTTSAAQTLTLQNIGTASLTGITLAFSSPRYSRPGGAAGGTCGATLAAASTCTINVVFSPTATGVVNATVAITANVTVTGSPVALSGTGVPRGTLSFTSATNGTLTTVVGVRTLTFTIPTPRAAVTSVVTVTNSGAAGSLLQITAETLPINIGGLYSLTGTTCSFSAPLAAGGTCTVSIRYATPAIQPTLPDIGAFAAANNGTTPAGALALSAR